MFSRNNLHTLSDEQLREVFLKGNDAAFTALYRRYTSSLTKKAYAYLKDLQEAEDVATETMLALFESIESTEFKRVGGWLNRILVNKCIDRLRKKRINWIELKEELINTIYSAEEFDHYEELVESYRNDFIRHVRTFEDQRQYIVFSAVFHGEKFKQIAERLGLSAEQTRQRYRKTIETVRRRMEKEYTPNNFRVP